MPRLIFCLLALAALGCGARSQLRVDDDDALLCPLGAFATLVRTPVELRVGAPPDARGQLRWEIAQAPAGAAPELRPDNDVSATFVTGVEGRYHVRVTAPPSRIPRPDAGADAGADPRSCLLAVNVRARGPQVTCPATLTTRPRQQVAIDARVEGDREIRSRAWTVESVPAASSNPLPSPTDQDSTRYQPDVAGDYRLRYTVRDAAGEEGSCEVLVRAVPSEALRVEMFWNPPNRACDMPNPPPDCDRSDVDLHLLRGGGSRWVSSDDCYYANCVGGRTLEWDAPGAADNPRLDIDDVNGFGPENINLDQAGSQFYRVGVHYFDGDGRPEAQVHVVIYCNGATPTQRFGPVTLRDRGSPSANDFWLVADVVMRPEGCEVRPIERGGAPWIFSQSEAQSTAGPPPPAP